ncbi:TPA: hypothetical protein OND91_004247 [Enterobacter roggenkampii]|nr:hypothetical protein [Enterobacter roggenkampii]
MSRMIDDAELVNLMAQAPHNFTIIPPPQREPSDYGRSGYVLPPTPDLELNGVSIRNVAGEVIALVEQKRATEAQRDELLAALEFILDDCSRMVPKCAEKKARAAIARVKGGEA